jgi:DNA-binding response OmpR family regulator
LHNISDAIIFGIGSYRISIRNLKDTEPGLDGFTLLRELRADPLTVAVPFLLLSARAGEGSAGRGT